MYIVSTALQPEAIHLLINLTQDLDLFLFQHQRQHQAHLLQVATLR